MLTLENKIVKSADKARTLREQMAALKNEKLPTAEYAEISKQIDKANIEINKLINQQQSMYLAGRKGTVEFQKIDDKISELHNELEYANGELKDLVDTGKAFTLGKDTAAYKKLGDQARYEESNLNALTVKHEELSKKQNENEKNYEKIGKRGSAVCNLLGRGINKVLSFSSKMGRSAVGTIKTFVSSMLPKMNSHVRKSNSLFGTLGKRIRSLAASAFLFNVLSNAFRSMLSGVKDGLKSYYKESDTFKRSIDSLYNSFNQLKANIASAFAPLIQVAVPYLKILIGYVNQAVVAVSQLIAALTGQSTFKRAVLGTGSALEDEAKSADKAKKSLEGYLSPIDEINKYKSKETEDTSGSSAGSTGPTYENIPVDSKWKNIAKWLKDMWKDGDFYDLGNMLGTKLAETLANIPWDKIKTQARKLGRSLATLINGFVESEFDGIGIGWWIGHTLAEAINTGFAYLNEFVHTINGKSIGKFLADTLNGILGSIEWDVIRDTFVTGAEKLADVINNFDKLFDWDNVSYTIANAVKTITDTIITFFEKIDWVDLGKNIGKQITKSIKEIDWKEVGRAIGDIIHSAIVFVASILSEMDWSDIINAVKDLLKGFFEAFDNSELPDNVRRLADALQNFGVVLATLVAIKGIIGLATNLGKLFKLFSGTSLVTNIGKAATGFKNLSGVLSSFGGVGGLLTMDIGTVLGAGTAGEIAAMFGATLTGAIAAWFAGNWTGKQLGALLFPEMKEEYLNFKWGDFFDQLLGGVDFTKFDEVKQLFTDMGDAWKMMKSDFDSNPITAYITTFIDGLVNAQNPVKNLTDKLTTLNDKLNETSATVNAAGEVVNTTSQGIQAGLDIAKGAIDGTRVSTEQLMATYPQLADVSEQTVLDITDGMQRMQSGTIINEEELAKLAQQSGYTKDAFDFLAERLSENSERMIGDVQNTSEEYTAFGDNVKSKNNEIKTSAQESWNAMSDVMKSKSAEMQSQTESSWQIISDTIKNKIREAGDECERIFSRIKDNMSSIGSGLSAGLNIGGGVLSSAFSSSGNYSKYSYKGYANGTVMPKTAQPHLAWFGDNNRETEVVSPLSTIKQAVREEMAAMGSGNNNNRPIVIKQYLDTYQVSEALIDNGKVQQMSTGSNAYALE